MRTILFQRWIPHAVLLTLSVQDAAYHAKCQYPTLHRQIALPGLENASAASTPLPGSGTAGISTGHRVADT
eukprot:3933139-Rhodomonas_salina.1